MPGKESSIMSSLVSVLLEPARIFQINIFVNYIFAVHNLNLWVFSTLLLIVNIYIYIYIYWNAHFLFPPEHASAGNLQVSLSTHTVIFIYVRRIVCLEIDFEIITSHGFSMHVNTVKFIPTCFPTLHCDSLFWHCGDVSTPKVYLRRRRWNNGVENGLYTL